MAHQLCFAVPGTPQGIQHRKKDCCLCQLSLVDSETQRLIHRLRELKDEYFQPAGGRPASTIKQEIVQTERAVVLEALREREQQCQERLNHLGTSLVSTLSTQETSSFVTSHSWAVQTGKPPCQSPGRFLHS
jgi:hypothetical protein